MPSQHEMELRAWREHYSDRLLENGQKSCEWHDEFPDDDCPECQALWEADQENAIDRTREER